MDIRDTKSKIRYALHDLALDPGNLRTRVPKAFAVLMAATYRNGFEEEFGRIDRITERVTAGNWSDVSDSELKEIAEIIYGLHERICS